MNWAALYLVCFLVGSMLSVLSFLGSTLHFHVPHFHLHAPHVPHSAAPHGGEGRPSGSAQEPPIINFATVVAFLTWFGGVGYLLTQYSSLFVAFVILAAILAGISGAAAVFVFIARILLPHDRELDPADYDRVGALSRVISSIRQGGTGEIIFSLAGVWQTCGARSENGEALSRGAEVIITRYEHGIAYVRRFDELNDRESGRSNEPGPSESILTVSR